MEKPQPRQSLNALLFPEAKRRSGLRRFIGPRRLLVLVGLVTIVTVTRHLRNQGIFDPTVVQNLIDAHPILSPVIFVLLYGLLVLSALPSIPANLAAGIFWGPLLGGVLSTAGATLAAAVAFAAARSILGRPLAKRFDNKFIAEIQREFDARGWLFLAFIRINPVFPTGILNYILGLTAIDIVTNVWVTFVFILPPSIAVALIGESLGSYVIKGSTSDSLRVMLTVSAAITALTALGYCARLYYRMKTIEKQEPNQ